MERADALWQRNNYRTAAEVYEDVKELLPNQRFVARPNGTVIDYEKALMWVADGAGPGAHNGTPMNWYDAGVWVSTLEFAGYDDWRLPSDEELQILADLPEEQRESLFPNTKKTLYWSRTYLIDNVEKTLCVDFRSGEIVLCSKNRERYVRPLRESE